MKTSRWGRGWPPWFSRNLPMDIRAQFSFSLISYYYMASSVRGQDKPNPALWLTTRAGRSSLHVALTVTRHAHARTLTSFAFFLHGFRGNERLLPVYIPSKSSAYSYLMDKVHASWHSVRGATTTCEECVQYWKNLPSYYMSTYLVRAIQPIALLIQWLAFLICNTM